MMDTPAQYADNNAIGLKPITHGLSRGPVKCAFCQNTLPIIPP